MKKALAILLSIALILVAFAACGGGTDTPAAGAETSAQPADDTSAAADDTTASAETVADLDYIKEKGTLVVGITVFAPMDYQEKGSDEWIGFDADMAKAFAEKLGVKAEFSVIDWDNKVLELNGKSIDCVWNGMTLGDEVMAAMSCSKAYCNNAQVIVVPADKAEQYATAEACKDLQFAVEAGSAGNDVAEENGFKFTQVVDQATALQEVAAGTSDAAIIDSLMAAAMVGEGTGFDQLTYTASLNSEEYGVGFRKGSDLVDVFNDFLDECNANGTTETIATQYGVQAALIK